MPRKSSASLSVVTPEFGRPEPSPDLTAEESEVWRSVVATKPADWFTRDMHPLLVAYCQGVVVARRVAYEVNDFNPDWLKEDEGLKRYDRLTKMQERQARLVANLATRMRLTQQSKYGARGAESKARAGAVAAKPWESAKAG